jgi:hypothetical protein
MDEQFEANEGEMGEGLVASTPIIIFQDPPIEKAPAHLCEGQSARDVRRAKPRAEFRLKRHQIAESIG